MILTFLVVSSVGFVSITLGLSAGARKSMNDELNFLKLQLLEYVRYADVLSTVELNDEQRLELDFNMETSTLVDGYDADSDYTILVFSQDDKILEFTNSPAYDLYMREDVVLGSKAMTNVRRLVETGEVAQIPWAGDFFSMEEERVSAQLAFVGAIDVDEYTVVLVAPFTQVFAQRETARSIQESALPRMFPAFPGNDRVDLFALMDPAREVGGDFYDFFELDDHTVAFLIADVSGKGIPASLFMMAAKNEIENRMRSGLRLSEAVAVANAHLGENNDANMFVTAWTATFDWKSGLLTYVNAGHNYPLLRHEGSWEWMSKKCGPILGVFEGARFREETIQMVPGDEVLLYTDGVNEAYSASEDEYGNDRLKAFVGLHPETSAEDMVRALRADVAAWAEGVDQSDDVTVLVMEYK
jgi:sigma-B regulation protein RsbU (phosphoserine phosphatase)